jgi:hypothetical protein
MLKNLLFYFLLICSLSLISQEKKAVLQEIQSTIQNYYDGYIERDLNKLNKAFDTENGTMKVPVIENDVVTGYKNSFFKDLTPIWGSRKKIPKEVLANCALEILNIDVVYKKIASAKISMKLDTITYIDILSLQKISGIWKITNKIYVVE